MIGAAVAMNDGGGNFFTRKVGGMPAWVWLAGAAVVVYFLMSRQSSAANRPTTTGGGGTITTGSTKVAKDAVRVTVYAGRHGGDGSESEEDNDQPRHRPESFKKTRTITVPRNETLGELAADRHWSEATVDDVGQMTQPKGTTFAGKKLSSLNMKLKKGDKIARPQDKDTGG